MTARDEYIRSRQAQLDKWNYDIDTMSARADKAGSHSMLDYQTQVELLLAMQARAREKIRNLHDAEDSFWAELKPGIELTWSTMAKLMDSASHHFR